MIKSTTMINNINGDRITNFNISNHNYLIFTILHSNLVIVEVSDTTKPILLLNRKYSSYDILNNGFDEVIISASKADTNDDFISIMDTYIDLNNINHNETTLEILSLIKIILETI